MSSQPTPSPKLQPTYPAPAPAHAPETPSTQSLITALALQKHIEGGYFSEIDRSPLLIPNPFAPCAHSNTQTAALPFSGDNAVRNASTSIYYLLTRAAAQGSFHRNKGRTVHTVIEGRGRYVVIHADEDEQRGGGKRVESFVVGKDVRGGEKAVWIVEGGKFKASYLLPCEGEDRLLISETVIPGFEYADHDFLTREGFEGLVAGEQRSELEWLVRKE